MASVVGTALDDLVGAVLGKKDDAAFLDCVQREYLDHELRLLKAELDRRQQASVTHEKTHKALEEKLATELGNQKDIFMYLNGEVSRSVAAHDRAALMLLPQIPPRHPSPACLPHALT
jgi:DNA-directed RNA polymerase